MSLMVDPEEVLTIRVRDLNPHVVCSLCAGYFIDATTITECLHTFCRSCIVKYLQTSKYCPTCNLKIHETQPLVNLQLDRTMQEIVLKVVPNLFRDEEKRRKQFYASRGLPDIKAHITCKDPELQKTQSSHFTQKREYSEFKNSYRDDELVSLCLERLGFSGNEEAETSDVEDDKHSEMPSRYSKSLSKKHIRCSVRTMVLHLQKYLRTRLKIPPEQQVEIFCNDHIIHPCRTMKFIWISEWIDKAPPIVLHYDVTDP